LKAFAIELEAQTAWRYAGEGETDFSAWPQWVQEAAVEADADFEAFDFTQLPTTSTDPDSWRADGIHDEGHRRADAAGQNTWLSELVEA
jgi:hypothetical protein